MAILYIGDSYTNSDIYYFSKIRIADPFAVLVDGQKVIIFISPLEVDLVRKESGADLVINTHQGGKPGLISSIFEYLDRVGIDQIELDSKSSAKYYKYMIDNARSLRIHLSSQEISARRVIKNQDEIKAITSTQEALDKVYANILDYIASSRVSGEYLYQRDRLLTSELIKQMISVQLLELGYHSPAGMIVSSGLDTADPHCQGSGPLIANQFIVFDLFPNSIDNGYFTDMSRTIIRGQASEAQLALYQEVYRAQALGLTMVKSKQGYQLIDQKIRQIFEQHGYLTEGSADSHQQGYFHGLGHGVGLDIHELPIPVADIKLEVGQVITIEPGLYYTNPDKNPVGVIGGVRIEDTLVVTEQGSINLAKSSKGLVI